MAPYTPPTPKAPTPRFAEKYTPKPIAVTCKSAPTSVGKPLAGKAVEAETEFMNEERMNYGWGSQEDDEVGTTAEPTPVSR